MAVRESEESSGIRIICENRKARFNYFILESFEAGIVLTGSEIKSIRNGHVTISEGFVRPEGGELFVRQISIEQYSYNASREYQATRPRKLLLSRREINKLIGSVERKGLTIIPLKLYLRRGIAKLEIGLAKGKSAPDKRDSIRKREGDREARRAMKSSVK